MVKEEESCQPCRDNILLDQLMGFSAILFTQTHTHARVINCDQSKGGAVGLIISCVSEKRSTQQFDLRIVGKACRSVYPPDENSYTTQQTKLEGIQHTNISHCKLTQTHCKHRQDTIHSSCF